VRKGFLINEEMREILVIYLIAVGSTVYDFTPNFIRIYLNFFSKDYAENITVYQLSKYAVKKVRGGTCAADEITNVYIFLIP
jgi:hypothetical protein